jgi:hypothetical protein
VGRLRGPLQRPAARLRGCFARRIPSWDTRRIGVAVTVQCPLRIIGSPVLRFSGHPSAFFLHGARSRGSNLDAPDPGDGFAKHPLRHATRRMGAGQNPSVPSRRGKWWMEVPVSLSGLAACCHAPASRTAPVLAQENYARWPERLPADGRARTEDAGQWPIDGREAAMLPADFRRAAPGERGSP